MRLLIACSRCKRQFDVSGWPIGATFCCHCGAVVTIQQPQGHDAAVVRCSSCGAPRVGESAACSHCGSDFTAHEQDLDTVCPQCSARLGGDERFCHSCGAGLDAEQLTGKTTEQPCPACEPTSLLAHRQIGETTLLECRRCAGFWVDIDVLRHLIDAAAQKALGKDWRLERTGQDDVDPSETAQQGKFYRKCPVCGKLMNRRNYGHRSGVIIDTCREHGVWFDADELTRVLAWIQSGGMTEAQEEDAAEAAHQERLDSIARDYERLREEIRTGGHTYTQLTPAVGVIEVLLKAAGWFLR